MNVLVAEDEPTSLLVLRAALKRLGHNVDVTTDGHEAFRRIQTTYFPIIISDWMMPGWDGLCLCRAIRKRSSEKYTHFVLLTARGERADFLEAMEAGVDDFLVKPLDIDELAARINVAKRLLGLHRQIKQLQGLLPICSHCKRIRDEHDGWNELEDYIARRSDTRFTHGICSECTKAFFPST